MDFTFFARLVLAANSSSATVMQEFCVILAGFAQMASSLTSQGRYVLISEDRSCADVICIGLADGKADRCTLKNTSQNVLNI